MKQSIMLLALLAVTNFSYAQITSERDMAEAIFKTIQNNDLETFSSYCSTKERFAKLVDGMGETTPKEKAIKQDLKTENSDNFRNECINKFKLLLKELTDSNISIKDGVFPEMITNETRVEVTNLKAIKIKFTASFNTVNYEIKLDIFKSKEDLFIYDFHAHKL